MAVATLTDFLLPQVVGDVVSRIKKGRGPLGSWLGFQPSHFDPETVEVVGPNTLRGEGSVRNYTYRIFDHTRVPTKGRAPGTGPTPVSPNPAGQNTVSIARFHTKMPLQYEFLGNLSPLSGPNAQIDQGGQDYIARQTSFLAEQQNVMVEMMAAGMMRDSLYFTVQASVTGGDDWLPSFTAPAGNTVGFQIPFLIPAGNKLQLNMLGTGNIITVPWSNVGAPIVGNLQSIIAAYRQISRYPMTDTWINSILWYNILVNTEVRNTAGSANTPFAEFEKTPETGWGDTGPEGQYSAILRGQPTVKWHFCDDVVALQTDIDPSYGTAPSSATLAKLVPDNLCIFCTEPAPDWTRLYLGGEYVVENYGATPTLRTGHYFWHEYQTQPAVVELISLLNAVPALYVPGVIAPATVIGSGVQGAFP